MKRKYALKSRVSLYLAGAVLLGSTNGAVFALEAQSTFSDTKGHWAASAIERMSDYKIVNGYNGLFRPSDPITRGEMSVIINHIMGYQNSMTNIFSDLEEMFYTDAVLKAYHAGLLLDTNGTIRPKDNITREEVALMIYNAFDMEKSEAFPEFIDFEQIETWAFEAVSALASKGIVKGSEGKFRPDDPITRAEAVTILDRILTGYYNAAGTYIGDVNGTAVISASDANLKDTVIKGDLIIAEGVAEGDIVLENVTVEGRTIVRGGGVNSIKVEGNSKLGDVVMAKEGSAVRLAISDSAKVNQVTVDQQAKDIVLTGTVEKVKVESKDARLTVKDATINEIEVAAGAQKAQVIVEKGSKVNTVNAQAESTISGAGRVSKVNANANDILVKTEGTSVTAGKDTTGVMAGKDPVKGGTSSNTNKPSSSSSSSSSGSSNNGKPEEKPEEKPLSIDKVESVKNGLVRVTLNKATDKVLTKDQFSIICTGAGKDMTVLSVSTQDNKVYDLATSYFDDNTYSLGIILEDGKLIEKDFVSKFDCPEISGAEMIRLDGTSAEFTFVSDTSGTFYYGLGKAEEARTLFNEEPTAEELMEKGTKVDMKYQYNEIQITSLEADTPYTLYYVAVDGDNKVTPVKRIQIAAEPVQVPEQGEFSIVDAKGFTLSATDFFDEMGGFELVLNQATKEPLTLEDFTIICPKNGKLTLGRVETQDNKTYKVYMKRGYNFVSGNTYTATITFKDGTEVSKKFFVDVWVDDATEFNIKATTDGVIQVSFKTKEAGKIYYDVTDEDQKNDKPKDPSELYKNGKVKEIKAGYNILEGIEAKAGQWFRYALEDELGNRMTFYSYEEVPAYVADIPGKPGENEEELEVTNIEVDDSDGSPILVITFNKPIKINSANTRDIRVTNVEGKYAIDAEYDFFAETDTLKLKFRNVKDLVLTPGEHDLTFKLTYEDKDGDLTDKIFVETFTSN